MKNPQRSRTLKLCLLATLATVLAVPAQAATFYLTSPAAEAGNWNNVNNYRSNPDGTGTAPATLAGNDISLNGHTVQTITGNTTFGGDSLLFSESGGGILTLRGGGTMRLIGNTNVSYFFDPGDATGYTGNVVVGTGANFNGQPATLIFGTDLVSGGGVVASDALSRLTLTSDVTLASISLNGDSLAEGTYTYAFLNANYDTIFTNGGSGSITIGMPVIPEPASAVLLLGGLGTLLLRRRRES